MNDKKIADHKIAVEAASKKYKSDSTNYFTAAIGSVIVGGAIALTGLIMPAKTLDSSLDSKIYPTYTQSVSDLRDLKHVKKMIISQYCSANDFEKEELSNIISKEGEIDLDNKISNLESQVKILGNSREVKSENTKNGASMGLLILSVFSGMYFGIKAIDASKKRYISTVVMR